MLLEEFDAKKYERTIRNEGREEGIELGRIEGISLGRIEGISLGREKGRFEHMVILIGKKKSKGCTAEETADMLEEDIKLVNKVYNALDKYDAEKEWEKIAELLNN